MDHFGSPSQSNSVITALGAQTPSGSGLGGSSLIAGPSSVLTCPGIVFETLLRFKLILSYSHAFFIVKIVEALMISFAESL